MDIDDVKRRIYITEKGLKQGNTYLKEWAISGQSGNEIAFGSDDTGALGSYWDPKRMF